MTGEQVVRLLGQPDATDGKFEYEDWCYVDYGIKVSFTLGAVTRYGVFAVRFRQSR